MILLPELFQTVQQVSLIPNRRQYNGQNCMLQPCDWVHLGWSLLKLELHLHTGQNHNYIKKMENMPNFLIWC